MAIKEYAVWDPERKLAFRYWQEDTVTGDLIQESNFTFPRDPAARVEMREVISEYPENYMPRFGRLLGRWHFIEQKDGTLRRVFQNADFSVQAVREELKSQMRNKVKNLLGATDWYFTRQIETGKEIPDDVLQQRKAIREELDSVLAQIDALGVAELPSFSWEFTAPEPRYP